VWPKRQPTELIHRAGDRLLVGSDRPHVGHAVTARGHEQGGDGGVGGRTIDNYATGRRARALCRDALQERGGGLLLPASVRPRVGGEFVAGGLMGHDRVKVGVREATGGAHRGTRIANSDRAEAYAVALRVQRPGTHDGLEQRVADASDAKEDKGNISGR